MLIREFRVHKKGNNKEMKNYRPLALLAVAGMILERVVAIQIEGYLESSKLLYMYYIDKKYNST